jgi:hypothetical protein
MPLQHATNEPERAEEGKWESGALTRPRAWRALRGPQRQRTLGGIDGRIGADPLSPAYANLCASSLPDFLYNDSEGCSGCNQANKRKSCVPIRVCERCQGL